MILTRRRATLLSLLLACAGSACSPDPIVTITYEAYTGDAYPDREPPIAWPSTRAALVTNSYADTISVIDLDAPKVADTRPVGRNPVDLDGPHHVAVEIRIARFAYTALSYPRVNVTGPHASHGSSSIPGYVQKLSLDTLEVVGNVRVDKNPGDVVLSSDGTRLVVSHFDLELATKHPDDIAQARASIAIIDPASISLTGASKPTFVTTCVAPHGVLLDGSARAFVACYGEDSIAIVDLDHPEAEIERVPVASNVQGFGSPKYGPYALARSHDGKTIAVSNTTSKDVRFFDVATKTFDETKTITLLGAPYFTAWSDDDKTLYVPIQQPDGLLAIPLEGGEPKSVVFDDSCQLPHVVTTVDDKIYVVCEGDHEAPGTVVRLDADLTNETSVPVGRYPDAFAILPVGFK